MSPEPIILYFPRGTCWWVHAPPVVAALQGSNQTSSFHYWRMSPDSQIDNDRCTDFTEIGRKRQDQSSEVGEEVGRHGE